MRVVNIFQLNDLNIKSFLKIILAIQLAVWGAIGLNVAGLQIPILRQLIGFIYLTFVPGILILRILKLHKLGNIETLLYTFGLSIATLMFTGLLMNTIYPFLGISGPISATPLIITISIVVLALCVLSYVRDKDFSDPSYIDVRDIISPPVLFLCMIPFLAVFGTYLVNFYDNNILLMFLIVIIALIVILIAFDKFIPNRLYSLAIVMIALALLFHGSLISNYLRGWDIHTEYFISNLIKMKSFWDMTIPNNANAMLSIVMLAPIYSNILNMDLTWVYKIIYPFLFSMVPLGLYPVFRRQTDGKTAFLSCFFFVSVYIFFSEMLGLARQQIAELFLVLLILLMIDKNMDKIKRSFLFIIFGISLAVSHYGLSYIYMFYLISAWLILVFMDSPAAQRLTDNFFTKFSRYKRDKFPGNQNSLNSKDKTVSSTFVLLFVVFALTWYMYLSSSSAFNAIVYIGNHIAGNIFTDFLNPEVVQGLNLIIGETVSPLHNVTKYLYLLTNFFIAIGIITLMLKYKKMNFREEYVVFSVISFAICFGSLVVPYFSSAINTTRLYHITLFFLSPFCIIGGVIVFRILSEALISTLHRFFLRSTSRYNYTNLQTPYKLLSIFLVMFFLFNSGFIYEVANDIPTSILSINRYEESNIIVKDSFSQTISREQNVFSAKWFSKYGDRNIKIYADYISEEQVLRSYGMMYWKIYPSSISLLNKEAVIYHNAYVYLRYINVVDGIVREYLSGIGELPYSSIFNLLEIRPLLKEGNKIYTNGGSEIYYYE